MRKSYFLAFLIAALLVFAMPSVSTAQVSVGVGISVHIGPPALPVVPVQPIAPGPGYMWTPGYWAYGPDGYYWVPGTWVVAPVGMLWTPGYWGWGGGAYLWHAGYWGPHVGFYGGINYGFGYGGVGFVGGRWNGGVLEYNTAISHVNVTVVHNTYVDKTVIVNNTTVNRVSFNGGEGGVRAEPTAEERVAMNEHHMAPIAAQTQHEHAAAADPSFRYSANHGHPAVVATAQAGHLSGPGAVGEHGAAFHAPANNNANEHGANNEHAANNHPPANQNHAENHPNNPPQHNEPHNNPKPEEKKEQHDNH
jgi:WXXGXW repeat (2 copies)